MGNAGNFAAGKEEFQKVTTLDDLPWYRGSLGPTDGILGELPQAEQTLRDLEDLSKKRYVSPASQTRVYLELGEEENAIDWLEKAFDDRDPILWWIESDQLYDNLRAEPRFQALMQKIAQLKETAQQ